MQHRAQKRPASRQTPRLPSREKRRDRGRGGLCPGQQEVAPVERRERLSTTEAGVNSGAAKMRPKRRGAGQATLPSRAANRKGHFRRSWLRPGGPTTPRRTRREERRESRPALPGSQWSGRPGSFETDLHRPRGCCSARVGRAGSTRAERARSGSSERLAWLARLKDCSGVRPRDDLDCSSMTALPRQYRKDPGDSKEEDGNCYNRDRLTDRLVLDSQRP